MSWGAQYARAAGAGLLANGGALGASLMGVWLINQILDKEQFGAFSFAMAVLALLSVFAAGGLDQSVMYRLSRLRGEPGELAGGQHVNWVLRVVLATGIGTAALACVGAILLASQSDLPGLRQWLIALSIIAPLAAVGNVFAAWNQAQMKVDRSLVVPRLNEVSQAALLLVAWLIAPSPIGVAFAVVTAAAVPVATWLMLTPRRLFKFPRPLPSGDAVYGLKMMLTSGTEQGVRRVDLLMVGILGTAVLAADYALAARLVAVTTLGHQLLGAVLTPRMGRYLQAQDYDGLATEYDIVRSLALALGLGVTAIFVALGKQILSLFGEYVNAYPVLLILSAAFLVKISFGANGRYLNMSGRAAWNLSATVLLLAAMIAFNTVLVPTYGAIGAAVGTLVSFAVINVLQSGVIWWKDRLPTMRIPAVLMLAMSVSLVLLASYGALNATLAATGIGVMAIIAARKGLPVIRNLVGAADEPGPPPLSRRIDET